MVNSATMVSPPEAVIDVLNSLLEADLNSIFRFMGQNSPYLSRASADVRRPLQEMVEANERHGSELATLIDHLGGVAVPRLSVRLEEQYLAFLSLKFLLPKLVEAKKLCIQRYENAIGAIGRGMPEVNALLASHLAEHRTHLQVLTDAAAQVAQSKAK